MAATRLIALHINKGKTLAQCLEDRIGYAENDEKTNDGELISSYRCDRKTCAQEFLLSKMKYEHMTGRKPKNDVIAYQIRQSFKPGEITPEEANAVGYELAMRFTKGQHAFTVSTHIDRAHIHNHVIFNSTTLDCTRKFKNFKLSGLALARLSDIVCLEHNLSVIQRKPYSEREKRTEYPEQIPFRDEICDCIDAALKKHPTDFYDLIRMLQEEGYEFKNGKHPAVRGKGQKRFARFRSLGPGYSVEELSAVIAGTREHTPKQRKKSRTNAPSRQPHQMQQMSFLIDIRVKLMAGKGAGYAQWAKVFNVKQMARAMLFMEEHNLRSFEELQEKASNFTAHQETLLESIKVDETRLQEIAVMKTHIINYAKAKDTFAEYKKSGYSRDFFETHRDVLTLRRAAKQAFDEYKKVHGENAQNPTVKELSAEYAEILARKKKAYSEYKKGKEEARDWQVASKIVEMILSDENQQRADEREQEQKKER